MADEARGGPVREWRDVDRDVFEREIVPAGRPALMRGLVADWPLVRDRTDRRALAEALAKLDAGKPVETFVGPASIRGRFFFTEDLRGFNFARQPIPLAATLAKLVEQADAPEPLAIYAGAASTTAHMPAFAASHPMPLAEEGMAGRIWIGSAVSIAPHFDASRNIACVLAGRRRFTFFAPDEIDNLYVGPLDHTIAGQPSSMVDPDAPDLDRYPRFRGARARSQVADLAPGDAVYVPPLWWHAVRSFEPLNVLVNYWSARPPEGSPFEALVHALLTVRDLPDTERAAWRAFFDHYVFAGSAGDAAAHLPDAAQGILGPSTADRTARIKGFLARGLG